MEPGMKLAIVLNLLVFGYVIGIIALVGWLERKETAMMLEADVEVQQAFALQRERRQNRRGVLTGALGVATGLALAAGLTLAFLLGEARGWTVILLGGLSVFLLAMGGLKFHVYGKWGREPATGTGGDREGQQEEHGEVEG